MDSTELQHRFAYHPPKDEKIKRSHEQTRDLFHGMAHHINQMLPDGREKSLAITALEESMFWTNAGIARVLNYRG